MKASWRWLIYQGSPQPGNPGAFVVQRRVELAAQYMLTTDASLSDIALRCGFTDQPHLCRHFRQTTGYEKPRRPAASPGN
jgi:transcriptional regulator GlxA family with amidase domain